MWIHRNTQKSMLLSKKCVTLGMLAAKKTELGISTNKDKATVFWETRSAIHNYCFQKEKQAMANDLPTYWTDLTIIWRKTNLIWSWKNCLSPRQGIEAPECTRYIGINQIWQTKGNPPFPYNYNFTYDQFSKQIAFIK